MNRPAIFREKRYIRTGLLILAMAAILSACGGEKTSTNPVAASAAVSIQSYSGLPPASQDVQSFKLNVWDYLSEQNRCGACHGEGGQVPTFARFDDINLAYDAALTVSNLVSPSTSRMVAKVAGGHNCWLSSNVACGDIITTYITNWAGSTATGAGKVIQLVAPAVLLDPQDSRSFPPDSTLFASTVHPLLTENCASCHVDSAANAQSPFFADSDPDSAYEAAKSKMDLDLPGNSRFVLRLQDEFHNCWDPDNTGSSDCAASAALMEERIALFAGDVDPTIIDPALVTSKKMTLPEGIVASGGQRHEDNIIALYEFKAGSGTTAFDTSGISPALDLTLSGNVGWVGGYGIDIISGKAQGITASSRKLYDGISLSGEYSIEAWVVPANVSQDDTARIISYSGGPATRNFTLGQTLYEYDYLNRNTATDANGATALSTTGEALQATLQHVVATYDPVNGRRIYINGVFTGDQDTVAGASLIDWDDTFAFVLGNEVSGDEQWQGKIRMVAIHNRALTPAQIVQNFDAGVGEKYFLLFSVTDLVGIPDSFILFEVSQFDNYSYLFNKPIFISLDPDAAPANIPVAGMRIGINGKEAATGQAYSNMDSEIDSAFYDPVLGQSLSDLGTVIALEKGSDDDEFFLTFEVLGNNINVVIEPAPLLPAPPPDLPDSPEIGLRIFDEINASMAVITGVSAQQAGVKTVFETIKQQLPTVENIGGFLSAHQMAVSQLAIEYCSALVDNNGSILRQDYFPGFFPAPGNPEAADSAFDSPGKRNLVMTPLINKAIGTGLTTQPDSADVTAELDQLILQLTSCATGPAPTCASVLRTEQIVKAVCAATLGSAVMLLQ
jgi:mono/diheme cytochrome c family protein